jgi:hypothetical protein
MYVIQHCFICRPSDLTVSDDAVIKPRPIATLQLLSDDVIVTSPDDVMYGEDLESEVITAGALPAQAHAGKRPCTNQSFMKNTLFIYISVK